MYWIYILECSNGHLYTGSTDDLAKRYSEHQDGTSGAKYTRSFRPVRIAQCWKLYGSRGTALRIEHFIKRLDRKRKMKLIEEPGQLKASISESLNMDLNLVSSDPPN